MTRILIKGNEAFAEAAIRAGCRHYFGYPITPQSEVMEYLARRMPEVGGVFIQAESEVAAINMVYGAAATGARSMTTTSSPGFSLMQEGISYMAGAELPAVLVNVMRGGPGVGSIQPAQSDYLQATKGGGNGDYRLLTYAPATVQEMADITMKAWDKAEKYRNPVLILVDGFIGQMMEAVEFKDEPATEPVEHTWAVGIRKEKRPLRRITSSHMDPADCERHNRHLKAKFDRIRKDEVAWEELYTEDAEVVLAAFGVVARVCRAVVERARKEGIKAGLIRPITVWPFPYRAFRQRVGTAKAFFVVEMNEGQMVEDVQMAVGYDAPVYFYGRNGGIVPQPNEVASELQRILAGGVTPREDRI